MPFKLQPWQARRVLEHLTKHAKSLCLLRSRIGRENGDLLPSLIERAVAAVDEARSELHFRAGRKGPLPAVTIDVTLASARLTHEQFWPLNEELFPLANYVVHLKQRMGRLPFSPDDRFFRLVLAAQDILQHLAVAIHYAGCKHIYCLTRQERAPRTGEDF